MSSQPSTSFPDVEGCKCKLPKNEGTRRNLVVCIDGTTNQFGSESKNTNVIELYSRLIKNDTQLTYYNSGIGTYAEPSWRSLGHWKQVLSNMIDIMIAWNFERIVINAYRWLVDNYQPGDRIYLFGFSRGAYQVRVLAGMIDKVGLIYRGNEDQIPFAYELYADHTNGVPNSEVFVKSSSSKFGFLRRLWPFPAAKPKAEECSNLAGSFKDTFSRKDVRVHFTGVWDTVSSIGMIRDKNLPGAVSPGHTCFFRHALALDERRVKFLPEYARGGVMLERRDSKKHQNSNEQVANEDDAKQQIPGQRPPYPHIKEVWFPGYHSDVGGRIDRSIKLGGTHAAFQWMAWEAKIAQLRLNSANLKRKWEYTLNESLTGVLAVLEWVPITQLTYEDADTTARRFHKGQGRQVQPGQKIHISLAFHKDYIPKASLPPGKRGRQWGEIAGCGEKLGHRWTYGWEDILEMEVLDLCAVERLIQGLQNSEDAMSMAFLIPLTSATWCSEGRSVLRQVENGVNRLFNTMQKREIEAQVAIANIIIEFCDDDPTLISSMRGFLDHIGPRSAEFLQWFLRQDKPGFRKLKSIRRLLKDDDLRRKLLGSDIITVLLDSLEDQYPKVRLEAIHAVRTLAECNDSDIIVALLKRLEESKEVDRWSILDAITGVAEHDHSRRKMLESGIIASLLQSLRVDSRDVRRSALNTIAEFAKYGDSCSKMLDFDIISPLLKTLGDSYPDVCLSTFNAMTELVKYDDSRRKILDSNIVAALLKALGEMYRNVRRSTIHAKRKLAKPDSLPRNIISQVLGDLLDTLGALYQNTYHSVFPAMKGLAKRAVPLETLRDEYLRVYGAALKTMWELAKHDDSRSNILYVDMVETLLKSFGDCDEVNSLVTLMLVKELARNDNYRHQMLEADIFVVLLESIGNRDEEVRCRTVNAITELVKHDDSRRKMLGSNIVESLIEIFGDEYVGVYRSTLEAVVELAKHDDSRNKMLQSDVVGAFLISITERSEYVCTAEDLNAIKELAKYDDSRSKMLDYNVVELLLGILKDEDSGVQEPTLASMRELAAHNDSRSNMLHFDLEPLFRCLRENTKPTCSVETLDTILELSKHEGSRHKMMNSTSEMRDSNLVNTLSKGLKHGHRDVRQSTAKVIVELAEHNNLRSEMLGSDSDIVGLLLWNLRDEDWDVRQSTLRAITELTKYDDSRARLLKSNIIASLLKILRDDSSVHRSILNVMSELAKHEDSRREMFDDNSILIVYHRLKDGYDGLDDQGSSFLVGRNS